MNTSENPNNTSISKSKKKRTKRKQTKQPGDDVSSVSSVPSVPDNNNNNNNSVREPAVATTTSLGAKLNPIDSLRMELANRGYRFPEIEAAMSEMWDMNLPYDSFDDVLAFLKGKTPSTNQAATNNRMMDTTTCGPGSNNKEVAAVTHDSTTDSVTAPTTASYESMSPTLPKDQDVTFEDDLHPSTEAASPLADRIKTNSSIKRALPHLDLVTKLQLVADYENLHDAIFAITQWASHAKPNEVCSIIRVFSRF